MKFIKGAMIGCLVATVIYMMYSENENKMRKKLMKNGKKMMKKIGIV